MIRSFLLATVLSSATFSLQAQWEVSGILAITNHFNACAFHQVDTGIFVYGANNPGPSPSATEGGLLRTTDGASGGGGYIWYQPSMFLEDIDVKMAGGKPWYIAAGHELYNRSVVVRKTLGSPNPLQFDSVRTGTGSYYRAIRMRNDLVAFAAGGTSTGDGIIDMSLDTGSTWANIAMLPGQPVSRLHFVNDQLGFAVTGGYSRLFNNGLLQPDSGAIYRSTNGGMDWEQVHTSTVTGFSDVDFQTTEIGVATRNDGVILRTTDGGDTWTEATVILAGEFVLTSVVFRNDGLGFASAYRADGSEGIILSSSDGGASWGFNYSTEGMNGARRIYDLYFFDDAHGYASAHWKPLVTDGLVTAVPQQDAVGFELFPNPSTDRVTLRTMVDARLTVELIDGMGRVVLRTSTAGRETTIDLSEVKPGVYLLRSGTGKEVASHPLLRL
ncbi:MAG: T9SS type A sorting domain-containing protein [Flavobacteriales bacterium]|nr:T9SS type A sorting domain-containing protein [Flavobacteriales bacterium]